MYWQLVFIKKACGFFQFPPIQAIFLLQYFCIYMYFMPIRTDFEFELRNEGVDFIPCSQINL